MIICKTPLRISFFGGGSDYKQWVDYEPGLTISTTIDKYIYITLRELPKFFDHNYRIVYSKVEMVKKIDDIKHHAIKGILRNFRLKNGLEIHYDSDLPAKSGMGSSSAFVVGLLHSLYSLKKIDLSKKKLALNSIYYEQKILNETVGMQDQIACSYGGFNEIRFLNEKKFIVKSIQMEKSKELIFQKNLFLVYTNISRRANDIANTFVNDLHGSKKDYIKKIIDYTLIAKKFLRDSKFDDFGLLLGESWDLKKKLSNSVSNSLIDNLYSLAIKNGATGGKLLGAGGGGFFLFYVPKQNHQKFKSTFLKKRLNINFNFEQLGSQILTIK
jgi:D-glycero-alpha-D-manno-heptose-7-phosphate kinase